MVGDTGPLGLCLKNGGGSLTFADNSVGAKKRRLQCVSQCISCGSPLVYTSHMCCRMQPLVHPPTSLLDTGPLGLCLKNGGGSLTFADNSVGAKKRRLQCVSQCIYIYMFYIHIL